MAKNPEKKLTSDLDNKMASALKAIMDLPMAYHGSIAGVIHRNRDSAWSTGETIHVGLKNGAKAQSILAAAGFGPEDSTYVTDTVLMLKNRAESLSAESDGMPAIAAFATAWMAWIAGAMAIVKFGHSGLLSVVASVVAIVLSFYFLNARLSSRRKVSGLRELANHLEAFSKTLAKNGQIQADPRAAPPLSAT